MTTQSTNQMVCAVTGANGYVGSRITHYLRQMNFKALELARSSQKKGNHVYFSLSDGVQKEALQGVHVLIHCAYDFRPKSWEEIYSVNVEGSRRLFESARDAGVQKIILFSTMSAFEGCTSKYGRAKLVIEKLAQKFKAMIIRPGLIYGEAAGGMVGTLNRLIDKSPVIPLIDGGSQKLYLAHEEDVAALVAKLALEGKSTEIICAAHPAPYTFKEIISEFARRKNKQIRFVSVPWELVYWGVRLVEMLGVKGIRSDSLISLVNQNPNPDFSATLKSGINFRPFIVRERK